MTTYYPAPVVNGNTYVDANGRPLAGGTVTATQAGSQTQLAPTWSDGAGQVPAPNPVVLDSAGRLPINIYLQTDQAYALTVRDPAGTVIVFVDDIYYQLPEV